MSHEVTIRVPDRPIGRKDIVFSVKQDGGRFGRLKVSKGCIVWLPGSKSKGFRLSWAQLDRLARDSGRRGNYPV